MVVHSIPIHYHPHARNSLWEVVRLLLMSGKLWTDVESYNSDTKTDHNKFQLVGGVDATIIDQLPLDYTVHPVIPILIWDQRSSISPHCIQNFELGMQFANWRRKCKLTRGTINKETFVPTCFLHRNFRQLRHPWHSGNKLASLVYGCGNWHRNQVSHAHWNRWLTLDIEHLSAVFNYLGCQ